MAACCKKATGAGNFGNGLFFRVFPLRNAAIRPWKVTLDAWRVHEAHKHENGRTKSSSVRPNLVWTTVSRRRAYGLVGRSSSSPPQMSVAAQMPRMIAMSAISGMMKPPRSCSPSTVSVAGATSLVEAAAEALACAAAIVGAVIKATEAAAAISPLKATSASPFVPESDCLDFETF